MAQQTINIGASPNDGTGTPLRTAFQYTNSNFSELYTALGGGSGLPGASTQVLFNNGTNIAGDAGLVYNSTTDALTIGGNVQAASATITGAATVGATLGVTGVSTFAAGTALLPALTTTGDTNTGIYYPAADTFAVTTGGTERYRVDASGNCGIGVTPSAWGLAGYKGLEIGVLGNGVFSGNGDLNISSNSYYASGSWKYAVSTVAATSYQQNAGQHIFKTAASGTAGNAITFTTAMTLDASGRLILLASTTTPATLSTNGQLTFTATSDTNLRFSYRGSDGVTRTADLTLA